MDGHFFFSLFDQPLVGIYNNIKPIIMQPNVKKVHWDSKANTT